LTYFRHISRTRVGESAPYKPSARLAATQPSLELTLKSITPLPETLSTLSTLTLAPASSEKVSIPPMTVHHYLYEGWPDFGVPRGKDVEKLQELIKEVGRKQKEEAAGGCEVWVHWYVFISFITPLHEIRHRTHSRSLLTARQGLVVPVPTLLLHRSSANQCTHQATTPIIHCSNRLSGLCQNHCATTLSPRLSIC
jgi:protein tyrosine phosphatase